MRRIRHGSMRGWISGFLLVFVVAHGGLLGQEAQDAASLETALPAAEGPCVIDEHLSLWLSLETVDRIIASLEQERRDTAADMARMLNALDILERADQSEGVPLSELNTLVQAQATGRGVVENVYIELQARLSEIDKTIHRRQKQQAMLEAQVEAWMERAMPKN